LQVASGETGQARETGTRGRDSQAELGRAGWDWARAGWAWARAWALAMGAWTRT